MFPTKAVIFSFLTKKIAETLVSSNKRIVRVQNHSISVNRQTRHFQICLSFMEQAIFYGHINYQCSFRKSNLLEYTDNKCSV
jgi:hypothetical protein